MADAGASGGDAGAGEAAKLSLKERREQKRRLGEAQKKARAIDKANDKRDKKDQKSMEKENKKAEKGKQDKADKKANKRKKRRRRNQA